MGLNFDEQGVATVDRDTCVGCGQCVEICPSKVLELDDGAARRTDGIFMGCIACGHCMMVCPTESISVSGRELRPEDRRELRPAGDRATAEQFEALIAARRSVRKFEDREVERELVERIVEMTSTAPMGIPPHEVGVLVFHGREKVRALSEYACQSFGKMARFFNPLVLTVMRPFVGRAGHAVLRDFVRPLLKLLSESRSEGIDVFAYDAPVAMVFYHSELGDTADATIAATYAMLAAESLGLGSCLLGTVSALDHDKKFKAKYGLPAKSKIGLGLILGYPNVEFQRGVKRRLAAVEYA